MHGKNAEFGNLIPGKFCFWREIFAILRGNLSFRWIFWYFSSKNFWKFVKYSHFLCNFWPYSRESFEFFPALVTTTTYHVPSLALQSKLRLFLGSHCHFGRSWHRRDWRGRFKWFRAGTWFGYRRGNGSTATEGWVLVCLHVWGNLLKIWKQGEIKYMINRLIKYIICYNFDNISLKLIDTIPTN